MFNSEILDVAIGLVFVYLFLSILCSVIIEMATSLAKKRPRMLKEGILSLLQDPKALDRLYKQPVFMGKTTPRGLWGSLWGSLLALVPVSAWKERVPSYISSRSFILSLLESLKQNPEVVRNLAFPAKEDQIQGFKAKVESLPNMSKIKTALLPLFQGDDEATLKKILDWYDKVKNNPDIFQELLESFKDYIPTIDDPANIKKLVGALPGDNAIKGALMPLLESAGKGNDALDKAFDHMEKWYDEAMDRLTGWYKRYSQTCALVLAFIVAMALNVDTFEIGKALYRDPTLRTSIVTMAEAAVKKGTPVTNPEAGGTAPAASQGKPGKGEPGAAITPPASNPQKVEKAKGSSPTPAKKGPKGGPKEAAKPPPSGNPQKPQQGQREAANSAPPSGAGQDTRTREKAGGAGASDSEQETIKRLETISADIKKMESLNLPLGWGKWWDQWLVKKKDELKDKGIYDFENKTINSYLSLGWILWPDFPGFFLPNFLGILFTALMVSLGSNFWFELLNKLINMRNAGKKPPTKEEKEAKKA